MSILTQHSEGSAAEPAIEENNNGSPFRILGSKSTRSDLASRREIKFTLPGADLCTLRHILSSNCHRVIHNEPVSTVRSIYFDNVNFAACYANLAGIGRRQKVRLRWYDSLQPGKDFFFEIKWRNNLITGKHRLQMRALQPLADMAFKHIVNGLIKVLPPQYIGHLLVANEPVALVEYHREHFVSADGQLRMTLDYNLAFYDQSGKQSISTSFPQRLHHLAVIEGKTPVGREAELKALLYPLALRSGRCSKYVHGCRHLGFIPYRI
ncbi:MAG: polyphosphate polymerase domain-containing protein [Pirellulales bacterium]|nr:polyphosphate polymerase domain-containing protein [Pirellulales bacterium]